MRADEQTTTGPEVKPSTLAEARAVALASPRRRVRVPGEPGVFVRATSTGKLVYDAKVSEPGSRRQVWKVAGSVTEAKALRAELKAAASRGKPLPRSTRMRFAELAEEHYSAMEARKRAGTLALHRQAIDSRLNPKLGTYLLTEITTDVVAAHVSELLREGKVIRSGGKVLRREPLSHHTVRNTVGVLSKIMGRAVRKGYIPSNPVSALESEERPSGETKPYPRLEAADLRAFLARVPEGSRTLIVTALSTGLRQSELLGLRWRDVDHEAGELHVRQAHGRHDEELKSGNARRSLTLHPETAQLLAALSLDTRHDGDDDYVFATTDGQPLSHRDVQRVVEKAREAAGLNEKCAEQGARKFTFHGLRHAYGSLRIDAGENLADVSRAMGHAEVTITDRIYGHAIRERDRLERERAAQTRAFSGVLSVTAEDGDDQEHVST